MTAGSVLEELTRICAHFNTLKSQIHSSTSALSSFLNEVTKENVFSWQHALHGRPSDSHKCSFTTFINPSLAPSHAFTLFVRV